MSFEHKFDIKEHAVREALKMQGWLPPEDVRHILEVLTEMRYFNEEHKMKKLAWNALRVISPYLSELTEEEAFGELRDTTFTNNGRFDN